MLKELKLKNFRCFNDYKIEFDKFNIIVGRNNTGKSTIIDALKLVSNVSRYAPYRNYFELESNENVPEDTYGCYIEDRDIPFSQINLRHNYIEEDSIVHSKFSDNTEIKIIFPVTGRPFAYFLKDDKNIYNKSLLRRYFRHSIGIIPPVGTFEKAEKLRDKKYIRSILISHLTPRHFRNIWHYFKEGFEEFQEIIEKTWPGYTIEPPELKLIEDRIYMFFRENGITREIFWAGHGFQVWLQLMTFLVKLGRIETLVLDEPDIYLHSDMQKKLVNICKERSNQLIIATHAVDIIEEVDPEDIISIDKNLSESKRLSNINEVQTLITQLGSLQNLKLINFLRGKSCLFVEGKDFRYLKMFANKLDFDSFVREEGFSVIPLEGFSNWSRLMHIEWLFKNAFGEKVKCFVILDRDYYLEEEINGIKNNLDRKGVKVHIWERKELENYIINFDTLYRAFQNKYRKRYKNNDIPISKEEFIEKILSIFEELKNYVISQMIGRKFKMRYRSIDPSTIVSHILEEFNNNWQDIEFRIKVIPGKEFFARLNDWLSNEYNITISVGYAIKSLLPEEIEPEVQKVINDFIQMVNS